METKFAVRRIFTITWVNCVKRILRFELYFKALLVKYRFFKKSPQISHIHKMRNLSSIIVIFLEQLLLPYKFHGNSMRRILFFNFDSCEPLNTIVVMHGEHNVIDNFEFPFKIAMKWKSQFQSEITSIRQWWMRKYRWFSRTSLLKPLRTYFRYFRGNHWLLLSLRLLVFNTCMNRVIEGLYEITVDHLVSADG